jgi:hypothetical protein
MLQPPSRCHNLIEVVKLGPKWLEVKASFGHLAQVGLQQ